MEYISVGKMKDVYVNISMDDFTVFVGSNNGLNDKKYTEFKKKSKVVYTVLGAVSYDPDYKSFMGYVVANDKGEIQLVKEDKLLSLLNKHPCMNFSLATIEGGKSYVRKNPKVVLKDFIDEDIKKILGYSFDDFILHSAMQMEQIEFCMKNNDFKLGFRRDFPVEYFGTTVVGSHLIYFNKEGTQIILNYVNRKDTPLNYYHQTCMIMRDVDHKKYHNYLRENPYNSCSSSPLCDTRDSNLDPNHTEMIFTSTNINRFLAISEKAKTYSKPIIPYTLGHNMYALHSILNVTPYQDKKIREYQKGDKDWKKNDFMRLYMGYLNMLKYSDDLKRFYSNCINVLPKYFEEYSKTHDISERDIQKMKKYVENLA